MRLGLVSASAIGLLATSYLERTVIATDNGSTDHVVTVGKDGQGFSPTHITAKKGETITFIFYADGHSATQTHFENPCAGMSPPSDSFCTVSSGTPKNDSSAYPTGPSSYPSDSPPPDHNYPASSSEYPSFADPTKNPNPADAGSSYPTGDGGSPVSDPINATSTAITPTPPPQDAVPNPELTSSPPAPPQCVCPAVPPPSSYPTGPDVSSPKEKTCDAKCIEVAGGCQVSTDCDAQSKSPSDSKCKIENGQCKKCDQSSLRMKMKRSIGDRNIAHLRTRLFRRQAAPDSENSSQVEVPETPNAAFTATTLTSQKSQSSTSTSGQVITSASDIAPASDSSASGANKNGQVIIGLDSGFVKVSRDEKNSGKKWKIQITDDSKPLWFMCATLNHCTSGMVFAVNAPETGSKTFDKFLNTAKGSKCPTQYPSQPNLQGDGCTAAAKPCGGENNSKQPATTNDTPPVSSGDNTPKTSNGSTPNPTVSSGESKTPPSTTDNNPPTPTPNPNPPAEPSTNTTTTDGKTPNQAHYSSGNMLSLTLYISIFLTTYAISGPAHY